MLLPALLQCFGLIQPPAVEKQIVSVVEAVVQKLSSEQLSLPELKQQGAHMQLCTFIKQLFETDSLASAMQGLRITEQLLKANPAMLREMNRHGLIPAVENLKKVLHHCTHTTALHHCTSPLHFTNALVHHCTCTPLHLYTTALHHCTCTPLHFTTALHHCTHTTALHHCTCTPLHLSADCLCCVPAV